MQQTNISVIQSHYIYYGLPGIPSDIKGLVAIFVGANGISDNNQVKSFVKPLVGNRRSTFCQEAAG